MPNENNQIPFETNPSFLDSTKKVLFNINWDLAAGGVRQLEIDAFKCLNSNINAVSNALYSPVDGTFPKTDATLFFARKRLITLIDIWNRILNSGLFMKFDKWNQFYSTNTSVDSLKIIGSNIIDHKTEYLFKNWSGSNYLIPVDFSTLSIFTRLIKFLTACINNYNWFIFNNIGKQSLFSLDSTYATNLSNYINVNYNPNNAKFIGLMNELLDVVKDLLDETKVAALGFDFSGLDFGTTQGRTNLLALDAYKSNYKQIAKIDTSYLNDDTKLLCQEWINTNSNKLTLLYPQFGSLISRNTESETWNFRNVAIDTAPYNPLDLNPNIDPMLKPYQTRYLLCSQLDMKRPLVFNTQFINWANENDRPYVMLYNGGTLVYIPDEIKDPVQVVNYERLNPDYTIVGGYFDAPVIPVNTSEISFTFTTDSTVYSNYNRKVFGTYSSRDTYTGGLSIASNLDGNSIYFDYFGEKKILFNGYKNQTGRIRLVNKSTGGSELYFNDELISSNSSYYDFSQNWGYSSTNGNRFATNVSITNLTYYYSVGNYLGEQPDNQLNLSAYFWKIGTTNNLDPNYNNTDDIKLKLPDGKNLYDIDKLDFLDNLTIYLKLN